MIEGLAGVNGLPEGGFACYMKVHHAAVDGVSGMEMVAALHDLEPEAEPPPPTSAWKPNDDPSPAWLLHQAMVHAIGRPMHGVRTARRVLPALSRLPLGASRSGVTLPSLRVPKTRFNGAVSAHRVIEARSYPLDDVKRMRKAVDGATINDAVLAIVGGALRRYLVRHGELPGSALTALVPISVRPEELVGSAGNQISLMSVTLGTDVADPLERLATVSAASKRSKGFASAVGARTLSDVSQLFPGKFLGLGMRAVTRAVAAGAQNLLFNTTVTNVPGPQDPLYFCGARAVEPYGAGPFAHGAGLIHLLGSYCGRMTFNVTACREMMPDPAFYGDCIDDAFEELFGAAS